VGTTYVTTNGGIGGSRGGNGGDGRVALYYVNTITGDSNPSAYTEQLSGGNSCDGSTDSSVEYICYATVQYHADPTDGTSSSDSPWWDQNWLSTMVVQDIGALSDTSDSPSVEMLSLAGLTITSSISYGSLLPGADTGAVNQQTVVTSIGNIGLNTNVSGDNLEYNTNFILPSYQKYADSTFTYSSGGINLSDTPVLFVLNIPKTTVSGSPEQKTIYWGLAAPSDIARGDYTGSNYAAGQKSDTTNW
jgi:hypothetical protein